MRHPFDNKTQLIDFEKQNVIKRLLHLLIKKGEKKKATKTIINVLKYIHNKKGNLNVFVVLKSAIYNASPRIKSVNKQETNFYKNDLSDSKYFYKNYLLDLNSFAPNKNKVFGVNSCLYKESSQLGLKLIIKNSNKQKYRTFVERLANEIIDSFENKSGSVKEKFLIEREIFRKAEID